MTHRRARKLCRHLSCAALLVGTIAAVGAPAGIAGANPVTYTGHRLYAVSTTSQGGTLVPFDISSDGKLHERQDQAVAVPGNTTGLLVDRKARSVFVSSREVEDPHDFENEIPGQLDVFTIAADGTLTLAQSVTMSSFAMALAPDGSLFIQQLDGEIDSFPIQTDGTLGAERTFYSFSQPATMLAIAPDGKTIYMDGENALWFQWTINPDWSLTSLSPGQWGPPGPACYAPFMGLAVGTGDLNLQCNYGAGFTVPPAANGSVTATSGTFTGAGGGNGNAEDVRGRAFYTGSGAPSVYQLKQQSDGTLAPFLTASVSSPAQISRLAADPDGTALVAATNNQTFETYTIAADGSLLAGPTVTPVVMGTPSFLAFSPQQAPVAAFSSTQMADGSTSFDAGASQAFGGSTIARYDWTFGDGTSLADAGPTPSHTYPQLGDFTATVTETDSTGCSLVSSYNGSMSLCAGSPGAVASHVVHVVAATPIALDSSQAPDTSGGNDAARPTAATAAPDTSGRKVLLTWAQPVSGATGYLIAWSTLHSAQGPGDPNMHHLRVAGGRTHILMHISPHTTIHFAVYAVGADGSFTRATKTTVRLPRRP